MERELDPMFPELCFCLLRNIFGRLMLLGGVTVIVFLFTGSYSPISSFITMSDFSFIPADQNSSHIQLKTNDRGFSFEINCLLRRWGIERLD